MVLGMLPPEKLRDGRYRYSDRCILKVALWAILNDRPFSWACVAANWRGRWCPAHLPDQSTLSRRSRRDHFQAAMIDMLDHVQQCFGKVRREVYIDGRALVVGGASKDPDAHRGRAASGFEKGYKLHGLTDENGVFIAFSIRSLNENEARIAPELVARAPGQFRRVVGDGEYDTMRIHQAVQARFARHYAPPRNGRVGRRQQPPRVHALRVLSTPTGQALMKRRVSIERVFGRMSNIGFGFKGLPPWVRRLWRVETWMQGKILFYHCYLLALQQQKCA